MRTRTIGPVTASAIGLGGMPMSIEGRPDEERSIRTIHAALDAGVTLIDTADAYHLHAGETGHNERLIAKALASYPGDASDVLVATKGGHLRPGDGSWTVDGSPAHLRAAAEASLKALGVDAIGLYQFHRPDPKVPYEESVGALAELLAAGKIRLAGISNASIEQIDIARRVLGDGTWPACRTSSRLRSAPARASCGTPPRMESPSCRGARSAESAGPGAWGRATPHSSRSPTRTGFRRSRSPWPGCSPRPRL
jgi:aryl-alcohol dehydrogenase-like predicted oxidoreductase